MKTEAAEALARRVIARRTGSAIKRAYMRLWCRKLWESENIIVLTRDEFVTNIKTAYEEGTVDLALQPEHFRSVSELVCRAFFDNWGTLREHEQTMHRMRLAKLMRDAWEEIRTGVDADAAEASRG